VACKQAARDGETVSTNVDPGNGATHGHDVGHGDQFAPWRAAQLERVVAWLQVQCSNSSH
jgi:hypothetical protein